MSNKIRVSQSGSGAPTAITPSFKGQIYIDEASGDLYKATGTSVGNWEAVATLISPSFTTPNLGTPSAGTLTNCSGLPVSGITASTSTAIGVGSIELGDASDTTLSRGAAGFLAVEGKRVPSPASQAAGDILYRGSTEWERLAKGTAGQVLQMNSGATAPEWSTLKSSTSEASSSTPSPVGSSMSNDYFLTALANGATFAAPSGTPVNGNKLLIRIKDNGTARSLAWNAIYRSVGAVLPTTTVANKTLYVGFVYNSAASKWDCIGVNQES